MTKKYLIWTFERSVKIFLFLLYKFKGKNARGHLNIQKFNTVVQEFALSLMNYRGGGNYEDSGEKEALFYVKNALQKRYSNNQMFLFDVGANVGLYSLELAKNFGEKASIHSFEPLDTTFEKLKENTLNSSNIIIHNQGLSNTASVIPFYTSNVEFEMKSSVYQHNKEHFNLDMVIKKDCQFTTVDKFCTENDICHIHFLKIDVEGHEMAVIEGAKLMIENKAIDFIQFEFGAFNIESRTYFQDFWYYLKDRYNIYRIIPQGLIPITKYTELMEIFRYSNYLAELKL